MYYVKAKVSNLFHVPANTEKGYPATYKVQLLGDMVMQDGQKRLEMINLSVPLEVYDRLKDKVNQEVTLPVGFFVQRGQLVAFFPKGEMTA